MKKLLKSIVLFACLSLGFLSCGKEDPNAPEQENVLSETSVTGHAESITPLGATLICYANLPADISAGTSFGVLYSTDANPTFETAHSKTSNELNSNNQYSITISGLIPATKYYFRSFVNQNGILKYGRIKDFATTDAKIVITGSAEKVSAISASIPIEIDLSGISPKDVSVGVCYSIESEKPELYKDSSIEGKLSGKSCSVSLMALTPGSTYHYRAYAIIDGSQIYGDCLSFTTGQDCIATTNEPTEISHIAAIVSGKIDLTDCSYQSATLGICYDEGNNPSLESKVITIEKIEDGVIIANLSGLEPDKVYYYRAFATIDNSTHYGAILYFRTPALYKEVSVENISSISAVIKTSYNMADTEYTSTEFGVCYNAKGSPSISDQVKKAAINDSGLVEIDLLGLNQDTKYYVRPYAKLDGTLLYGEIKEFTTLGLVTGCSASNISGVSATLAATYDLSNALYEKGEFGVCYGTSSNPTNLSLGDMTEGNVSVVISSLQSNTKYYYRGYAKLDGKVYYGEVKNFTTAQFVKAAQISNISPISAAATAGYDLTDAVFKNAVYGVCLSTSATPTINDIKAVGNLDGSSIELNIKKLVPATSYYYRGYAVVDGVTHYGEIKQFATGECRFFTTGSATDITYCSATLSAKYDLGNSMYDSIVYGICYSDKAAPTIADYTVTATPDASGNASFAVKNLICSTEYYYKPYVTVDGATYYGTQRIFETAWDPFVVAELEAGRLVDLGLSVHWATYNVGASKPEEIGNLYAWGEISPKDTYTWQNYKFTTSIYNDHPNFSKYTNGLVSLEPDDDVACARLGGTYRMPTKDEFEELLEKCSWEIATVNGIQGYRATGPSGKSIFFPAILKVVSSTDLWQVHYWSKTPYYYEYGGAYWQETAWTLYLYVNTSTHSTNRMERYIGYPVRAISPY
mgnify:CR=1 FL=1